ncbi:Lsr2 family protein [Gordonia sinesedis]
MAKTTVVRYVDDIDGKELKEAVTVAFGVDGKNYEFDTSPTHAREFRRDIDKYLAVSRSAGTGRGGRGARRRPARRSPQETQAVRTWARDNGFEVSDRGRIAAEILTAYEAAH